MKDWRLIGQESFYKDLPLKRIKFPDFWEESVLLKNKFYSLILEDATKFVEKYQRGKEYLERGDIQAFWHAHCDFCTQTITTQDDRECYCTKDYKYWICKNCFDDFYKLFNWKIEGEPKAIRFFYRVIYKKMGHESSFDLGIFSNIKNARKKIEQVLNKEGFKEWRDGFSIVKFGVRFREGNEVNKTGLKLFSVTHEYEIVEDGICYDIYKYFKAFSLMEEAEAHVRFLKIHTNYGKRYPNGFEINTIIVDNYSSWSEGFTAF